MEGSSASAPVWLKLERKEGSIYAYESGDGVNWVLITSISLALNAPLEVGIASQSELAASAAQFTFVNLTGSEGNQTTKVPFTIDQDEVVGATTIWDDLFGDDTALQGNATGDYLLPEPLSADHPIEFVNVSKSSGEMIGLDVLIWQEKEELIFNAENTAIAVALADLIEFGFSESQLVQAYPLVRNHPKIPELRQLMLVEQGYPDSDSLLDQIADIRVSITIEVIEKVRAELSPQRVVSQFPPIDYNGLPIQRQQNRQNEPSLGAVQTTNPNTALVSTTPITKPDSSSSRINRSSFSTCASGEAVLCPMESRHTTAKAAVKPFGRTRSVLQ